MGLFLNSPKKASDYLCVLQIVVYFISVMKYVQSFVVKRNHVVQDSASKCSEASFAFYCRDDSCRHFIIYNHGSYRRNSKTLLHTDQNNSKVCIHHSENNSKLVNGYYFTHWLFLRDRLFPNVMVHLKNMVQKSTYNNLKLICKWYMLLWW